MIRIRRVEDGRVPELECLLTGVHRLLFSKTTLHIVYSLVLISGSIRNSVKKRESTDEKKGRELFFPLSLFFFFALVPGTVGS